MEYPIIQSVQCPIDRIVTAETRAALYVNLFKHLPLSVGIPNVRERFTFPHVANKVAGILPMMKTGVYSRIGGDDGGKKQTTAVVIGLGHSALKGFIFLYGGQHSETLVLILLSQSLILHRNIRHILLKWTKLGKIRTALFRQFYKAFHLPDGFLPGQETVPRLRCEPVFRLIAAKLRILSKTTDNAFSSIPCVFR